MNEQDIKEHMKKYEEKFREFCNNTNMENLSLYQKEVEIEKFGKKLQAQLFEEYLNQPSKSKKKLPDLQNRTSFV